MFKNGRKALLRKHRNTHLYLNWQETPAKGWYFRQTLDYGFHIPRSVLNITSFKIAVLSNFFMLTFLQKITKFDERLLNLFKK